MSNNLYTGEEDKIIEAHYRTGGYEKVKRELKSQLNKERTKNSIQNRAFKIGVSMRNNYRADCFESINNAEKRFG